MDCTRKCDHGTSSHRSNLRVSLSSRLMYTRLVFTSIQQKAQPLLPLQSQDPDNPPDHLRPRSHHVFQPFLALCQNGHHVQLTVSQVSCPSSQPSVLIAVAARRRRPFRCSPIRSFLVVQEWLALATLEHWKVYSVLVCDVSAEASRYKAKSHIAEGPCLQSGKSTSAYRRCPSRCSHIYGSQCSK